MRSTPPEDPLEIPPQIGNTSAARCANGAGQGGRFGGIRHAEGTVNTRVGNRGRSDFRDACNATGPSPRSRGLPDLRLRHCSGTFA